MENELFIKLLKHEDVKDVPLSYVIVVYSAIQEIQEKEKAEDRVMAIS